MDVAIVGGGLAGAAAALRLGRAGARVVLFEREAAPRPKVCGEFLSPAALVELAALGMPAAQLGALPLGTVRMAARAATATTPLPFRAASLTRDRLDAALLEAAASVADVRRGASVRTLGRDGTGWRVGDVAADRLIVATGKHDFPGRRRPAGLHGDLVGLKLYASPTAAARADIGDAVELHLFPHGYCGIQPVEDGRLNVCLAVAAAALKRLGGPAAVFAALSQSSARAGDLLAGARLDARPLGIGPIPYGFVRTAGDGADHVGDQAAVVPSFCGEGMALALVSARMAADAILAGVGSDEAQRAFARRFAPRVRAAAMLSRLLVAPLLQGAAVGIARLLPAAVRQVASMTRTPVGAVP